MQVRLSAVIFGKNWTRIAAFGFFILFYHACAFTSVDTRDAYYRVGSGECDAHGQGKAGELHCDKLMVCTKLCYFDGVSQRYFASSPCLYSMNSWFAPVASAINDMRVF